MSVSLYDKSSPQYVYWQGQIVPADTVAELQPGQPTQPMQQPMQQQPMPTQAPAQTQAPQAPQIPSYQNESGHTVYDHAALQNYYAQMQMQQQMQEQHAMAMEEERTRPWFENVANTMKSWVTTNPLKGITSTNTFHDVLGGLTSNSRNLARGIQSLAELGLKDVLGVGMGPLPALEWLEEQSERYATETAEHDADRGDVGFIPKMWEGFTEGLATSMAIPAAGGALVGAGAGLLTGGATGPAAPVTAPTAAVTAGNVARTSLFYLMSVGELYYDAVEAGVDPEWARLIAAGVGMPYAYVENMQFQHIFGTKEGTRSAFGQLKEFLKQADKSTRDMVLETAKIWAENTFKETGEEALQEAIKHAQTAGGLELSGKGGGQTFASVLAGAAQAAAQEAVDVFPGMVMTGGVAAGGAWGRHAHWAKSKEGQQAKAKAQELKEAGVTPEFLDEMERASIPDTGNIHEQGHPQWAQRFEAAGATVSPVHMEHHPTRTTREQAQENPAQFLTEAIADIESGSFWAGRTGLDKNSFLAQDLTEMAQGALESGNAEDLNAAVDTLMDNGFEPVSEVERAFRIQLPNSDKSIIVAGIDKSAVHKNRKGFLESARVLLEKSDTPEATVLVSVINEALESGDKELLYHAVEEVLDEGITPDGQTIRYGDNEMGVVALMRLVAPTKFSLGNKNIHEESHLARMLFLTEQENQRIEADPRFQRGGRFDEEIWANHVQAQADKIYNIEEGKGSFIDRVVHGFQTRIMDFLRNLFGYKSVDQLSREIIDGTLIQRGVVTDAPFQESLGVGKAGFDVLERDEGEARKEAAEKKAPEAAERAAGYQRAAEQTVGQQIAEGREEAAEAREKEAAEQLIRKSTERQEAKDLEEMAIEIDAEDALKKEEFEKIREEIKFLEEYEALEKEEELERLREKEKRFQEEIEFAELLREEQRRKELDEYAEEHGLKGLGDRIIERHKRRTERETARKERERIRQEEESAQAKEREAEEKQRKKEQEEAGREWLERRKKENPDAAIAEDIIGDPLERAKAIRRQDEDAIDRMSEETRKKVKTEEESKASAEAAAKEKDADKKFVEERVAKNEARAKEVIQVASQDVRDEIAETTAAANKAIANIFKDIKLDDLGTSTKGNAPAAKQDAAEAKPAEVAKEIVPEAPETPASAEVVDKAVEEGKPIEPEKTVSETVEEIMTPEEEWISARETASMLGDLRHNLANYKLTGQLNPRKDGQFKKSEVLNVIKKEKEPDNSPEAKMLEATQKVIKNVKEKVAEAKETEAPVVLAEREGAQPLTKKMVDRTIEAEGKVGEAKTEKQITKRTKEYVDAYKKGVLGFTTILEGPDVVSVPLSDIKLSKDVPQFKQGADARGLTAPLGGEYQAVPARPIILWRRNTGALEVITGCHRFALAQDTPGVSTIQAQILNEADGFTADMAAMMDITSNIQDEKGEVRDYAQFFREGAITEAEATAKGFLQTAKGKQGFTIGQYASDELYTLYRDKHGKISDRHRGQVDAEGWTESRFETIATAGRTSDGKVDADLQSAAIKHALKNPRVTNDHLLQWMNSMRYYAAQGVLGQETDLFGEIVGGALDTESEAMAGAAVLIQREEQLRRRMIENAKKQGRMQAMSEQFGIHITVQFENEADAERQLNESIQRIEMLQEWYLYPDLVHEIRKKAGLAVDTDAIDNAITESKETDDSGQAGLFSVRKVEQPISSKNTSLNQIPATFKRVDWKSGTRHFDLGAGRSTKFQDALAERGIEMLRYDPFWNTIEENSKAIDAALRNPVDTVSVNNVLNVIGPLEAKLQTVRQAAQVLKDDGEAYFLIHEGDRSGIGKETTHGWQSNMKAVDYMPIIEKYFREVERKRNLITARKPMKAPGKWSPVEGGARFSVKRGGRLDRKRYDVGKIIGGRVYMHKIYAADQIGKPFTNAEKIFSEQKFDWDYNTVSYNPKEGAVTFQEAPNFDTAREPQVGRMVTIREDGTVGRVRNEKQVYHHKQLWVEEDYDGFNTEDAQAWSNRYEAAGITSPSGHIAKWSQQLVDAGLDDVSSRFSVQPVSDEQYTQVSAQFIKMIDARVKAGIPAERTMNDLYNKLAASNKEAADYIINRLAEERYPQYLKRLVLTDTGIGVRAYEQSGRIVIENTRQAGITEDGMTALQGIKGAIVEENFGDSKSRVIRITIPRRQEDALFKAIAEFNQNRQAKQAQSISMLERETLMRNKAWRERVGENDGYARRISDEDATALVSEETKDLVRLGKKFGMSDKTLNEQIADIGLIVDAHQKGMPAMLLASKAGAGKTFVVAGAIRELQARGIKDFAWITQSQALVDQIKADIALYGIEDAIHFVTYHTLSLSKKGKLINLDTLGIRDKVLFLDEAHEIKGHTSTRGEVGRAIVEQSPFTTFVSATLSEDPTQLEYISRSKVFDKVAYTHIADGQQFEMKGFDALLAAHGGIVGKNGGNSTWRMDNRVGAALLYDWLHDRGLIIRRIPDITSDLVKGYVTTATGTTNSEHVMATLYNRASEALDYAIAIGANPMMVRMYTANTLNRIVEGSKADFAIEVAKGELTKGNRVVVFTEGRSERRMDMWGVKQDDNVRVEYPSEQIVEMYEASGGEHPGISDTLYKLAQAFLARDLNDVLPSVITQMENALREYGVSIYTGGVHHGQALKNKDAFMRGDTRVLLATMDKGGTGLSLHDTIGKFPTSQIILHMPWTGSKLDQVMGRTVRQGLASNVRQIILTNPALLKEFEKAGRVMQRHDSMHSLVSGKTTDLSAGVHDALFGEAGKWAEVDLMTLRRAIEDTGGGDQDDTSSSFSVTADRYQETLNEKGVNPATNAIATDGTYWDLLRNVSDAVFTVRQDVYQLKGQGALLPIRTMVELLKNRDMIQGSKWDEVAEYGKRFADAHKETATDNAVQYELNQLAVAIGNMQFDAAETHLNRIQYWIDSGKYEDIASSRQPGSMFSVTQLHDVNSRDNLLRVPLPALYEIAKDLVSSPEIATVLLNKGSKAKGMYKQTDTDSRIILSADIFAGRPLYEKEYRTKPQLKRINALKRMVAEEHGYKLEDMTHVLASRNNRHFLTIAHRDVDYAAATLAHEIGHADNRLTETMVPEDSPIYDIMAIGRVFKDTLALAATDPEQHHVGIAKRISEAFAEQHEITSEEALTQILDNITPFLEKAVRDELISLSKLTRGDWNTNWHSEQYKRYRESAEELYADFISAVFNSPATVSQRAPNAYKLFQDFLSLHKLSETYQKVQTALWDKASPADWLNTSLDMMARDSVVRDEAIEKAIADRRPRTRYEIINELLYKFVDTTTYLPRQARQSVKDIYYMAGPLTQLHREIRARVGDPMINAGISWEEVGAYMMLRRAGTEGDRQDIANPGLIQGKYADQTLAELKKRIGADKYQILEDAVAEYHTIRKEKVFPRLRESKLFSKELMKQIEDNVTYATFDVQKHFKAYQSGTDFNATIMKQYGTTDAINNPFFATVHKDGSLMMAAAVNKAKHDAIKALREFDPQNIMEAESKFNPKKGFQEIAEHENRERWGTMKYNEDGITKGVHVRPQVADLFKRDPYQASVVFEAANFVTGIFKRIFTANNPFFSIWNVQKDVRKTLHAIPTDGRLISEIMLVPELARSYIRTIRDAWHHAVKNESTPLIRELLTQGLLIPDRQWKARETTGIDEYERMQAEYGTGEKKAEGMWRRVARFVFDDFNQMVETWGKAAGYEYMQRKGLVSQYDMRDIMRGIISSPDFLAGGEYTKWTNMIFLYSNAGVQGLEASYRDIRRAPMTYFMRRMVYTILPTMAMIWLQYGDPDDPEEEEYQKAFRAIPDWEKKRMHVFPVSFDGTNVTWVPLPQDHFGELLHGIMWAMIGSKEQNKGIAQALSVVGGAMPFEPGSLNPALQVGRAAFDLMTGSNPWDHFRERNVVDPQIYRAGGFRTHQEFAKWAWNQTAGSVAGGFDSPFDVRDKPAAEKIPFVKAGLRRFYRSAAAEEEFDPTEDKAKAQRTISAKDFVVKTLSGMSSPKEITVGKAFSQWKKENPDMAKGYKLSSFRTIWKNASERRWPEPAKNKQKKT